MGQTAGKCVYVNCDRLAVSLHVPSAQVRLINQTPHEAKSPLTSLDLRVTEVHAPKNLRTQTHTLSSGEIRNVEGNKRKVGFGLD